jgi:DNA polymerase-3 subunit alpha
VRAKQGRIRSIHALCEDLDLRLVNKRVFESLVKAGAFDSLAKGTEHERLSTRELRPRLVGMIDAACEHGARLQDDRERGQGGLFGDLEEASPSVNGLAGLVLPAAAAWTDSEQLGFEKETLGLYWSGHPVDRYAGALRDLGARSTAELAEVTVAPTKDEAWGPGGRKPIEPDTSLGGIVAACRQLKTRKGDRMAVFTLEDAQGGVEVIAFPEAYQRAASLIETGTLVLVRGRLERDDESVRVLASEIVPIEAVHERLAREVKIRVRQPAGSVAQALLEIVSRHRGDRRLLFEIETDAPRLRVSLDVTAQIRVRPSPSLIAEVEQVVGQGAVSLR